MEMEFNNDILIKQSYYCAGSVIQYERILKA